MGRTEEIQYLRETLQRTRERLEQEKRLNAAIKTKKVREYFCFLLYIVFFANSFAATAGTNTRNATFKIVHSDLLQ